MAKRKQNKKEEDILIDLNEARAQAGSTFEKFQVPIIAGIGLLAILLIGWFGYSTFVKAPKAKEAVKQIYKAEYQFARDSFTLALSNPGDQFPGFLDIIDQYGGTPTANIAHYYAGICYLHLGNFEVAIDYLSDFSADGTITPAMKNGALGDAYSELNDLDQALSYYKKAASGSSNMAVAPYYLLKTGMLLEKNGNNAEALSYYEKIKTNYPTSPTGVEIEKYIARVSGK